jgi:hypothetical protein
MTITYSFEQALMTVVNGEKKRTNYSIVDGDKGATYYYLRKDEKSFKKIKIIEKEGQFEVKSKVGEAEKSEVLDEKAFKSLIKEDKDLDFIVEYLKNKKKSGGAKKTSKKVKRTSKKVSKKVKKTSKKAAK